MAMGMAMEGRGREREGCRVTQMRVVWRMGIMDTQRRTRNTNTNILARNTMGTSTLDHNHKLKDKHSEHF